MRSNFISRLVGFVCVAAMAASLVACGGDSGSGADEQEPQQSSDASAIEESSSSVGKTTDAKSSANDEEGEEEEESSSSVAKEDSSSSGKDEEVVEEEAIPTSLEGVNGYMQKGPFLSGSKVRVLELESGRTLNQTGLNFETKIQTDDGKFKLNARTMVSQYVELHAEGYYRNEVTGKESEAPITLYAITDVSKREGGLVNINLLTHLEYQRVVYLVKEKKMKFYEAKNKAQQEVLAMLDITDSKDFGNSEDLNVVGTTEADGALLAFSVMFQGDRSVAKLMSLLQSVVNDLEEDGKWDDAAVKTEIADWAETQDNEGNLDSIRKHVANWKLGSVPNFEKYVRHFWYKNYDLGECSDENEREILQNGNRKSSKKTMYFICENKAWREMSTTERDTYDYVNQKPWDAGTKGELKKGVVTDAYYVYDGEKWRPATKDELETYDYQNNRPWSDGTHGEKRYGAVTATLVYIFDDGWRKATDDEILWGICDATTEGQTSFDNSHICVAGTWTEHSNVFTNGSLWNMNGSKGYQVQTPEVVECTGGDPGAMDDYGARCFESTGGWWQGYDATSFIPGTTANISPANKNIDGSWKLIMADETDGSIIPGGNLVEGVGLQATLSTKGAGSEYPGVVGLTFYWTKAETAINISSYGGFCLSYSLSGSSMQMEVDWKHGTYGEDTWYADLIAGTERTIRIPWSAFNQDGWDKEHNTTIATATTNTVSLNFRLKNPNTTEMTSTFTLHSLGWLDECK